MSNRAQLGWAVLGTIMWVGCATPAPPHAPEMSAPDFAELFRRARFSELAKAGGEPVLKRAPAHPPRFAEIESGDWAARKAYREGDAAKALAALGLDGGAKSQNQKILSALLEHVDLSRPLRVNRAPASIIQLPLMPKALSQGYPVVEMQVKGRRFRMLWDTGATENVMSYKMADELELAQTAVSYRVMRDNDGYVVRFSATGLADFELDSGWSVQNTPWLVSDLATVSELFVEKRETLDGFLSPQLLIPRGCFSIDRKNAILSIGFEPAGCQSLLSRATHRAPLYAWDGEVYTNARIRQSPELAVRLETGSPATFLRSDAARYLPKGEIKAAPEQREGEIAHEIDKTIPMSVAGQSKDLSTIDLEPRRRTLGHDDIATLGNDMLLAGRGVVVSFSSMEVGFLSSSDSFRADNTPAISKPSVMNQ